jgi:hypothetical protein
MSLEEFDEKFETWKKEYLLKIKETVSKETQITRI